MIVAGSHDLRADRFAPFGYEFLWPDYDLTGGSAYMQVRVLPDAPGDPLIDLAPAALYSPGTYISVSGTDSSIRIQINEPEMRALPAAAETGTDLTLYYDLIIEHGGQKYVLVRGKFVVIAGVTQ